MAVFIFLSLLLLNPIWAATKIVGGKDIDSDSKLSLSVVALLTEYKGEIKVTCTGSLVAPKVVITAAHCINFIVTDKIFVSNGVNPLENKERIKVTHLLYHSPQFWSSAESGDDVAVLILDKDFATYKVLKLGNPHLLKAGTPVVQLGYGLQTFSPSQEDFQYPRFGKLQILDGISKITSVQKQLLETSSPGSYGVAGGDSGGPLILIENSISYLFGVTSTGGHSSYKTSSAGYTIPYYFVNWINSVLPTELEVSVPFEINEQFPKSNLKAISSKEFPAFNRNKCKEHRPGWDIDADQICWPSTKESCEQFERDDVPREVRWNEDELKCEVI